ncbi:MAG: pyruvate carboxylase subunit B [Candidatus Krumholzibacteria bacterium]|nr:pyruvate carboxylase subunit B [Candidatus Krumholzibacteria bacterium]
MPKNAKLLQAFKAVKVTDTTLRDGHQSTIATRMRTEDMLPIAEKMDRVGFYSMEVWGGATFDVATRYLNEDPWERLIELKKRIKKTPLQMLLRAQNLVGYRNYADDVVEAFVEHAAELGIDIFRVFDALNDERNFEASFKAIKKAKKHIQGTISFSLTGPKIGGKVYNLRYYIDKAKTLKDMGADSICIKDMAGILNPFDAYELIGALKRSVRLPIQLHCHYTSGMASMTYLKAIEAGVDVIDCALAPFGLRSSEPAVEPIVAALKGKVRSPGLDLEKLFEIGSYLETIAPKYRQFLNTTQMSIIDTAVLEHQIPGGMLTNLVSQVKEADALDRISEVYEELPRTRKELGYPPLVTPTSQIVGTQAVQNVLFGRYKMISSQVKDYVYGLYGRPPAQIDPRIQKIVLHGYPKGNRPITCRAADTLEPEMEKAREAVKDLAQNEGDVLIYALYPTTGLRFLKWKYGKEQAPAETKPKTLEDVRREDELVEKALKGQLMEKAPVGAPGGGAAVRTFSVSVSGEKYSVEVEEVGGKPRVIAVGETQPIVVKKDTSLPKEKEAEKKEEARPKREEPKAKVEKAEAGINSNGEYSIIAPMPGMVVQFEVKVGDKVKEGDVLVILEAMKMQNNLTSRVDGIVKSLKVSPGTSVEKDQVILTIAT